MSNPYLSAVANSAPLYEPTLAKQAFASYIGEYNLGNVISLASIGDADIRRLLMHEIYQKNDKYMSWHKNSFMELMKMVGAVKSTSQAYKVGYKSKARLSMTVVASGSAGGSAGAPATWTLNAASSLTQGALVDVDDIIEIGETRKQVQVIGIDTGASDLSVYGRDTAGATITPTSIGGAAGAHKIVVLPLQSFTVPAVTTSTKLFVVTRARPEGSCPTNSINGKEDDIFEFGWSTVDTTRRVSGTANSTAVSGCEINSEGKKVKVIADKNMLDDFLIQQYKLAGQIFQGQRVTNANTLMEDAYEKQNNGIFTQIAVNGGTFANYTKGSYSFNTDFMAIVDFLVQKGITEAYYWMGYQQYKELQNNVAPTYWKDNIQLTTSADGGMKFSFTTKAIEIYGVTLYPMLLPTMYNDAGLLQSGYAYTGVIIPKETKDVIDATTGEKYEAHSVNVFYKKDKYGRSRDENYMIAPQGGAALVQNGPCDNELTRYLTQVSVMLVGAENCYMIQGA